jgi:hypothetical protein
MKVKPMIKNGFKTRGEYTVARLLLERQHGVLDPKLRIKNTCGLAQCINPDHWSVPTTVQASPWRIAVYDAEPWRLVDIVTGCTSDREAVVRVRVQNVVHLARITHHATRVVGAPLVPFCGEALDVAMVVVTDLPLTCKGCA